MQLWMNKQQIIIIQEITYLYLLSDLAILMNEVKMIALKMPNSHNKVESMHDSKHAEEWEVFISPGSN